MQKTIAMIGTKGFPSHFGGVEKSTDELSRALVKFGYTPRVYARSWYTYKTGTYIENGVEVVHVPSINTKHLDAITHTFVATIHALCTGVSVFHYHGVGPALLSWIPRVFAPHKKVIVTFHCIDYLHEKWGVVGRFFLWVGQWCACAFPHKTIVVSKTLRTYIRNHYHIDGVYIPNGISRASTQGAQADAVLGQYGLDPSKYFIMVSRLVPHKGAHTLIEAWETLDLAQKGWKLVIVGGSAHTDAYMTSLQEMARMVPGVVMTGYQSGDALQALVHNAYATVHPSSTEGLPLTMLEALSAGKAVIASDIPEHREILGDELGFYVEPGNAPLLAMKLQFVADNAALLAAKEKAGRSHAESVYGIEEVARATATMYESLYSQTMPTPLSV